MGHMFTFINTSRVGTAVQGVAAAEQALQNSLWCAAAPSHLANKAASWLRCVVAPSLVCATLAANTSALS
jgi:hypothetical protein